MKKKKTEQLLLFTKKTVRDNNKNKHKQTVLFDFLGENKKGLDKKRSVK